jgi:hypothetical protein
MCVLERKEKYQPTNIYGSNPNADSRGGGKREIAPGEQNPQTFVSSYLLSHLNAYWQAIRIFIFLLSVLLAGEGRETLLFEKYSPAPPHGNFS